jgi:undecaprenyl phosphate-alpha-L-ara4N flippase subunit ArnE
MTTPFPYYLALTAAILIGACGQILLKAGAAGVTMRAQFLSLYTIVGLLAYAVAAIAYIVAIRRIPLSLAFPSVAASYVAVAIAAHYLWGEMLGWRQFTGMVLVGAGIFMLHRG